VTNKAVFLDRDGVLNVAPIIGGVPSSPSKIEDLQIIEGVKRAVRILKLNGFIPIVVTNQPDIARGKVEFETVVRFNKDLCQNLEIEHLYMCTHDDNDMCNCRKPEPGLIMKASADLHINLQKSFVVGDRWKDIAAGQAAGCRCFFIDYSYNEDQPIQPFTKVNSLYEATLFICN
jgi:D-glycero-D-manno-heptose 1,7-bisphosphate phosphatase